MSAQQTPGRWQARQHLDQSGWPDAEWEVFVGDKNGLADGELFIAVICAGVDNRQEANARLIAAAPETLQRLAASQQMLRSWSIARGTKGGSCNLCRTIWNGEAEAHKNDCVIRLNDAAIKAALGAGE